MVYRGTVNLNLSKEVIDRKLAEAEMYLEGNQHNRHLLALRDSLVVLIVQGRKKVEDQDICHDYQIRRAYQTFQTATDKLAEHEQRKGNSNMTQIYFLLEQYARLNAPK